MPRHIAEDNPLKCPKCGKDMQPHTIGAVTIRRCVGCSGLWADALAQERLLAHKADARAADTGPDEMGQWSDEIEGEFHCPADGSRLIQMVDHRQPHVRYERCTVCGGTFLDAGELRDLSSMSLAERLRAFWRRVRA